MCRVSLYLTDKPASVPVLQKQAGGTGSRQGGHAGALEARLKLPRALASQPGDLRHTKNPGTVLGSSFRLVSIMTCKGDIMRPISQIQGVRPTEGRWHDQVRGCTVRSHLVDKGARSVARVQTTLPSFSYFEPRSLLLGL